ncbi:MAG TPA: DUF4395 domain-containing protein [Chlorobaculum parvum]|uniref:DUF4395 domain-containing protein n=1 Tax=Chlorobaculum parvum TaxID=274539 RepID=A0A7C5DF32_9CHLB|nr:DUF4395 domain-containing protein [Chlorobaculum parvum]
MTAANTPNGIPMPIINLTRYLLLVGIILAIVLQQPLITTFLFFLMLPAVIWGKKASLIFFVGSRLLKKWNATAHTESPKLTRFNNSIAVILLGMAQIAFLFQADMTGYILSGIVALAAFIAICGFCVGCFLFFQYNMKKHKLFGSKTATQLNTAS